MIELGKMQSVEVMRETPMGFYLRLKNEQDQTEILLLKNQVSRKIEVGEEIKVFLYPDAKDGIIATMKKPKVTIGELAFLEVLDIISGGAFLDWGLDTDLYLPLREQKGEVKKGNTYLVSLFIDKNNRLAATMDIYQLLESNSPYHRNDRVAGTIYQIHPELGAFVAVKNHYHGLIPQKELYGNLKPGDPVEVRITKVRADGKLELSLRKEALHEIDEDGEKILDRLRAQGGRLPFNDNSDPEIIKLEFKMSKRAFKRAIGRLYKDGKIKMTADGIEVNRD